MNPSDRISLNPTAADVTRFNAWLDERIAWSGIDAALGADLKLCLNEVLANLISYGFERTTDPAIGIEIELKPGQAGATVIDNGTFFDLRSWEPAKDRDPLTAEHGGFGIALIKEHATELAYARVGGLNRLTILCAPSQA